MKKNIKFIVILILTIASLLVSFYLIKNNLNTFAIVSITLTAILFVLLIASIPRNKSESALYNQELKQILKKYDAILAEIGNIPNLEDKNIMLITNIEDMVDAAVEIRKPVYYKKEEDYCIFSLLDNQDTCIYILKQNKEEITPIEEFIHNRKQSIEKNIEDSRNNKLKHEQEVSNDNFIEEIVNDNEIQNTKEEESSIEDKKFYNEISENIDKKIANIPIVEDEELI